MKILLIVAASIAVLQTVSATGGCNFDPIAACHRCDFSRNFVQYVPNDCNCTEYYSCEKTQGNIRAHKQACQPCLCFSKDTWGCTDRNQQACPTEAPITEIHGVEDSYCYRYGNGPQGIYFQQYSEVLDPATDRGVYFNWIVNEFPIKMRCPAGTYFEISQCQCIHCVPGGPCAHDLDTKVFCLDFDNDGAERGTWYDSDPTCSTVYDSARNTNELQLPGGQCNVEIPYFQMNEFSAFTLCGWFRADAANLGHEQGLAFNGGSPNDQCHPGSIYITLNAGNQINGGIITGDAPPGTYDLTVTTTIQANRDYRVCLRYDGSTLDLTVYDVLAATAARRSIAASGVTVKNKCPFTLGSNFDFNGNQNFFVGRLDDWCFYRTAIPL